MDVKPSAVAMSDVLYTFVQNTKSKDSQPLSSTPRLLLRSAQTKARNDQRFQPAMHRLMSNYIVWLL